MIEYQQIFVYQSLFIRKTNYSFDRMLLREGMGCDRISTAGWGGEAVIGYQQQGGVAGCDRILTTEVTGQGGGYRFPSITEMCGL